MQRNVFVFLYSFLKYPDLQINQLVHYNWKRLFHKMLLTSICQNSRFMGG